MESDSSDDEIFWGPVTDKEKKLMGKLKGRRTLVLEKNKPLYNRDQNEETPKKNGSSELPNNVEMTDAEDNTDKQNDSMRSFRSYRNESVDRDLAELAATISEGINISSDCSDVLVSSQDDGTDLDTSKHEPISQTNFKHSISEEKSSNNESVSNQNDASKADSNIADKNNLQTEEVFSTPTSVLPKTYSEVNKIDYSYLSERYSTISLAEELNELSINKRLDFANNSKLPDCTTDDTKVCKTPENDMECNISTSMNQFMKQKDQSCDVAQPNDVEQIEQQEFMNIQGQNQQSKLMDGLELQPELITEVDAKPLPEPMIENVDLTQKDEDIHLDETVTVEDLQGGCIKEMQDPVETSPVTTAFSSELVKSLSNESMLRADSDPPSYVSLYSNSENSYGNISNLSPSVPIKLKHRPFSKLLPEEVITPPPKLLTSGNQQTMSSSLKSNSKSLAMLPTQNCSSLADKISCKLSAPLDTSNLGILSEVAALHPPITVDTEVITEKHDDSSLQTPTKRHNFTATTPCSDGNKSVNSPAREKFLSIVLQCREDRKSGLTPKKLTGVRNLDSILSDSGVKTRESMFSSLEIIDVHKKENYVGFIIDEIVEEMETTEHEINTNEPICDNGEREYHHENSEKDHEQSLVNDSKMNISADTSKFYSDNDASNLHGDSNNVSDINSSYYSQASERGDMVPRFDDTLEHMEMLLKASQKFKENQEKEKTLSEEHKETLSNPKETVDSSIENIDYQAENSDGHSERADLSNDKTLTSCESIKTDESMNLCDIVISEINSSEANCADLSGSSEASPRKFSAASSLSSFNPPMESTRSSTRFNEDIIPNSVDDAVNESMEIIDIMAVPMASTSVHQNTTFAITKPSIGAQNSSKPTRPIYKLSASKSVPVAVVTPNVSPSPSKNKFGVAKSGRLVTPCRAVVTKPSNSDSSVGKFSTPQPKPRLFVPNASKSTSKLPVVKKTPLFTPPITPRSVKKSPYKPVMGPVAKSLQKNPPPSLFMAVRAKDVSERAFQAAKMSGNQSAESPSCPPPSPANRKTPVLPHVFYKSAPSFEINSGSNKENQTPHRQCCSKPAVTPDSQMRVMKHKGRALMSQNAASDPLEVSVLERRSICYTDTLSEKSNI